jgi:nitrate/nitrite-specific signal transduction histidine kinase
VTAEVPSTLLCLQRQDFLASMQENSDVLQGVVHVLCSRLRARMLERHEDFVYMQQFTQVTQAAGAVEAGMFEPESLDNVALRTDELGQLARVFQRMAREVYARELRLRRQVQDLRIEIDQIKQQRRVDEITDTDYFRELQQKATTLRNQVSGQEET